MADHPDTAPPAPDDGDVTAPSREIVPPSADAPLAAGAPSASADGAVLMHWLEQNHRDAQANRAQARELVKALEQVRDAHEYVGRSLRDEQAKSRRLTVALVLAPILAGFVVWGVWDRMDAMRAEVSTQIREVAAGQDALRQAQDQLRFGEVAEAQEARADALEAELERVRSDLATDRSASAARAEARTAEEIALRSRIDELEDEGAEAAGLRAQLQALRSRSGAEAARATELEREIRRLERELGAVQAGGGPAAALSRLPVEPMIRPAQEEAAAAVTPEVAGDGPEDATPATAGEPDPKAGAVRRPEDLDRIRGELNRLLALAGDAVRYRVDFVGGVRGDTLLEVRVSGVDDEGRAIRTLEAKTVQVHVREETDDVLLDMREGHLLLAGRQAPFFDGRYAIVLQGQSEAWRISGLTCVTFD